MRRKVFITGASGMLGSTLYPLLKSIGWTVISTDVHPLDPWTSRLDIRRKADVKNMINECKPDWVFNLAALTDVEYCETHPQEAYDTNADGPKNVALVCRENAIPMLHISTAGVFDGMKSTPYTEADKPNPVNIYGKAKFDGDKSVMNILENYYILRAGWMMGGGERDKKFVRKVLKQIWTGKTTIYGLTDMYGCPTYTLDFARGILNVLNLKLDWGLYHMVSEGNCSRYDVAKKMIEFLKLSNITVSPVTGDFFKQEFFAPRPSFEAIENKKLHDLKNFIMRPWDEALGDYLNTYYLSSFENFVSSKSDKEEIL